VVTEQGWIKATTVCPSCEGSNTVTVFGSNDDVINQAIKCSICDELYSAEVTITFTASVTSFEHTEE
jgi:transposase-like protein